MKMTSSSDEEVSRKFICHLDMRDTVIKGSRSKRNSLYMSVKKVE